MDNNLRPNSNGLRPGKTKALHILAPRRHIKGVKSQNCKAAIILVGFKIAFDSVNR